MINNLNYYRSDYLTIHTLTIFLSLQCIGQVDSGQVSAFISESNV